MDMFVIDSMVGEVNGVIIPTDQMRITDTINRKAWFVLLECYPISHVLRAVEKKYVNEKI
jgi:hypothetical protein